MRRPGVLATSRVLLAGTLLSAALFVLGLALSLLDAALLMQPEGWSSLGVAALLLTPPASLLATAIETRRAEPATALLALVVLAILGLAAGFALIGGG
ncbi:MAG TPA: hypothetical protein VMP67_08630 [Candidatus Limnocylindria bacterium]|nr:hypothetical protein [Candidatus Limnocylindria bacterium]